MANDNKELKNNAPCEEKQEARELTDEELEQVNGGISNPSIFPLSLRKADSKDSVVIACRSPFGEDDAL